MSLVAVRGGAIFPLRSPQRSSLGRSYKNVDEELVLPPMELEHVLTCVYTDIPRCRHIDYNCILYILVNLLHYILYIYILYIYILYNLVNLIHSINLFFVDIGTVVWTILWSMGVHHNLLFFFFLVTFFKCFFFFFFSLVTFLKWFWYPLCGLVHCQFPREYLDKL